MDVSEQIDPERAYDVTAVTPIPLIALAALLAFTLVVLSQRQINATVVVFVLFGYVMFVSAAWAERNVRVWVKSDGIEHQKLFGRRYFDKFEDISILEDKSGAFTLVLSKHDVVVNTLEAVHDLTPVLQARVRARLLQNPPI
jgi:hypothetical protein